MEDFIFGTFSTNESRIAHVLKIHGGVTHAQVRIPRDPQPGQAVQIHWTTAARTRVDSASTPAKAWSNQRLSWSVAP